MECITSAQNGAVKTLRKYMQNKKFRRQMGIFVAEGEKAVREACADGMDIETIFLRRDLEGKLQGLPEKKCVLMTEKVMNAVSDTVTPQGVIALVHMPRTELAESAEKENALLLLCENVSDPGNLGTLIRCADAAGADGVVLCGCADLYNPKTVRSTMSSLYHIPVIEQRDAVETVDWLQERGFSACAASLDATQTHYETDFTGKTVLCVGNEAHGLTAELQQRCRTKVKIPMPGRAESLNVGCAAAVLLYEAVRQRMNKK